jgi:hypothetical protein
MNTILVFDLQGDRIGTLTPKPSDKPDGPSALALSNRKLYVWGGLTAEAFVDVTIYEQFS